MAVAFIVVAVVAGVAIGYLTGGRLRRIGEASFRLWPLLFIGIALQAVAGAVGDELGVPAILASYACLVVFTVANIHLAGMGVVAVGILMNALVIGANGGMPVRGEAIVAAGIVDHRSDLDTLPFGSKRHLEAEDDRFMVLADIIPVPIAEEVLSFGDLVMSVGVATVLAGLMRRRRVAVSPSPSEAPALRGNG
jgi:hypothetical protein